MMQKYQIIFNYQPSTWYNTRVFVQYCDNVWYGKLESCIYLPDDQERLTIMFRRCDTIPACD